MNNRERTGVTARRLLVAAGWCLARCAVASITETRGAACDAC